MRLLITILIVVFVLALIVRKVKPFFLAAKDLKYEQDEEERLNTYHESSFD